MEIVVEVKPKELTDFQLLALHEEIHAELVSRGFIKP